MMTKQTKQPNSYTLVIFSEITINNHVIQQCVYYSYRLSLVNFCHDNNLEYQCHIKTNNSTVVRTGSW
jgi:hypothetical protein